MAATATSAGDKLLTIGAVCRLLRDEFADVSISKIRYLEDQGLLRPRRTPGRYRLFSEEDVERLRTILRMQRDQFLPLRVIRQELAAPGVDRRRRRRSVGLAGDEDEIGLDELCEQSGITPEVARELEDFGLLEPRIEGGERRYAETDAQVAAACAGLARYGVAPRNLRAFRTATDREAALLEQLVAPALKSRNAERRAAGLDDLQSLAELSQELSRHLYWRALRRIARL